MHGAMERVDTFFGVLHEVAARFCDGYTIVISLEKPCLHRSFNHQ
jgi:hypothetical protein